MADLLYAKSIKDLSKRKARTILTVLTIALGVMGISLFAVSPLARESVAEEMELERLYNLHITVKDVDLTDSQIRDLGQIENVEAVSARSLNFAKYQRGERKANVLVVGIPDIGNSDVDNVILGEGFYPGPGEALTELVNDNLGYLSVGKGDTVTLLLDVERDVRISGTGRSIAHGKTLYDAEGYAVLYVSIDTAWDLFGPIGFNYLSFRLENVDEAGVTIERIREYLTSNTEVVAFDTLPEIREDGEWPGGEFLDLVLNITYILTLIAILASVFLISNTMKTMVAEGKKEIAMLKAIGASRYQVFSSYLTAALLMGMVGSILGAFSGIGLSYIVLLYFGDLMGFAIGNFIHLPTIFISIFAGIIIVISASIPALTRASSTTVREGMEEGVSPGYKGGLLEKALARFGFIPRSIQMGIGNTSRKRGRSVTTVIQTGLAVGLFIGLSTFGSSLGSELASTIDNLDYDIEIRTVQGGNDLMESFRDEIEGVEGVLRAEPYIHAMFSTGHLDVNVMGYEPETEVKRYGRTLVKGEWFSPEHADPEIRLAVMGRPLANLLNKGVGDSIEVTTATGAHTLEIIGIDDDFYYLGLVLYIPLESMQDMIRQEDVVTGYFIHTVSEEQGDIDRLTSDVEEMLSDMGYVVDTSVMYEVKEATISSNQAIVYAITILSSFIVLISMIGLTSNITMGTLERTREIGILRCLGAVSIKIRSIFTTEALTLTLGGWLLGIPLGYLIARGISAFLYSMMDWNIPIRFPVLYVLLALAFVVILTVVIAQAPISRATRMKPGDALRYQ